MYYTPNSGGAREWWPRGKIMLWAFLHSWHPAPHTPTTDKPSEEKQEMLVPCCIVYYVSNMCNVQWPYAIIHIHLFRWKNLDLCIRQAINLAVMHPYGSKRSPPSPPSKLNWSNEWPNQSPDLNPFKNHRNFLFHFCIIAFTFICEDLLYL